MGDGWNAIDRLAQRLRLENPTVSEDKARAVAEMALARSSPPLHPRPMPGDLVGINRRGRLECLSCGSELDPTMVTMTEDRKTRIDHVLVKLGEDGLGYVTTVYENGEKGHRSEGYGRFNDDGEDWDQVQIENLRLAEEYARADFEGLGIPVEVVR